MDPLISSMIEGTIYNPPTHKPAVVHTHTGRDTQTWCWSESGVNKQLQPTPKTSERFQPSCRCFQYGCIHNSIHTYIHTHMQMLHVGGLNVHHRYNGWMCNTS